MGNKREKRTIEKKNENKEGRKLVLTFVRQEGYTDATSLSDKEVF
jgi:hypothetical protein